MKMPRMNRVIKSTHIIFVSLTMLMVFMAVSCNNVTMPKDTDNKAEQFTAQSPVLKIIIDESARTIEPVIQPSLLKNFRLSGSKVVGEGEAPQTFEATTTYTALSDLSNADILLPSDAAGFNWDLTLSADLPGEGNSSVTYTAATRANIKAGKNAVKFVFMGTDLTTGTGGFSVTFDWSEKTENSGKVTSAKAVLETTGESPTQTPYNNLSISGNKVTVQANNIACGTYRLKMYLYKDEAQIAYWQDIVRIANGVTSTETHKINHFSKTYSITYVLNAESGVTNPCPQTVTTYSDLFADGKPQLADHSFINWYLDDGTWKQPFDVSKINEDTTVYARWLDYNDPHVATKENIAAKIAAVAPNDKLNPFNIKVYGIFDENDFTSAASALQSIDSCFNDSDATNDIYIALDFSETSTDVNTFGYFVSCACLAGIVIPDSIPAMSPSYQNSQTGITGSDFCYDVNLQYINASETNPNYKSVDGVLLSKDGKFLAAFPRGKEWQNGVYKTPDSVTKISRNAFCWGIGADHIKMGVNVSKIYDYSFYNLSTKEGNAVTITFEDTDTIWKASGSGTIYNINGYFAEKKHSNFTFYYNLTKNSDGATFNSIIQDTTVIPFSSENIITGEGTDEDNYDITSEGFYTIICAERNKNIWFSLPTTSGKEYHLYYCNKNTQESDKFENAPDQDELWYCPYLSVYSIDGKKCYVNRIYSQGTASFTAEGESVYICIEEAGYGSEGKKAFLLIREVEP